METGRIVGANGILFKIILQIGSVKLLQRLIQVLRTVYINAVLLDHHPGKALAILDIHIFQKGAVRHLGPGRNVFKVVDNLRACLRWVGMGHAANNGG